MPQARKIGPMKSHDCGPRMRNRRAIFRAARQRGCEMVVFRVPSRVRWRQEGDGLILYDAERDVVYHGNHTALAIIGQCNGRNTISDVAAHLAARYGLSFSQAQGDARAFIEQLGRWALLERVV